MRQRRLAKGSILMDPLMALVVLTSSVLLGAQLLTQFRLAEKRQDRDWVAAMELRNLSDRIRAMDWTDIDEQCKQLKLNDECLEVLGNAELKVVVSEEESSEIQGKRIDLQLSWIESNASNKPRTLTLWRFQHEPSS